MAGLREKVKGLNRFREIEVTRPAFDGGRAYLMIKEAVARVNEGYISGALEWARAHRPDLMELEMASIAEAEAAYHGEDMEGLRRGLDRFGRSVRDIVLAFEDWQLAQSADGWRMEAVQTGLFPSEEASRQRAHQHRGAL